MLALSISLTGQNLTNVAASQFRHSNKSRSVSHISLMQHQHLSKTFDAIDALFNSLSTVIRIKAFAVWAPVLLVSDHIANLVNRCHDNSATVLISSDADHVFSGHQSTLGHCTATFLKSLTNTALEKQAEIKTMVHYCTLTLQQQNL